MTPSQISDKSEILANMHDALAAMCEINYKLSRIRKRAARNIMSWIAPQTSMNTAAQVTKLYAELSRHERNYAALEAQLVAGASITNELTAVICQN